MSETNTTKTEQLREELQKTADEAITFAKNATESVQANLKEGATDLKEAAQKIFLAGLGALTAAEEERSKLFKKLVRKGEKFDYKALGGDALKRVRQQLGDGTEKVTDAVKERATDAKYVAGEAAGKVEDRVQEAVAAVMKRLGVPTREEISELTASVERLTKHVEQLKAEQKTTAAPEVVAVGGGWYEVRVGEVVIEKVQGKEAAEEALARLLAHQA